MPKTKKYRQKINRPNKRRTTRTNNSLKDNFKSMNDALGHEAGDQVLRHVADTLRACCADEITGRLGGDEFSILQHGRPQPEGARDLAERLHAGGGGPPRCT